MKKSNVLFCGILSIILMLVLAGCGPKGGTITLANESTATLTDAKISLGGNKGETLYPGQWIRASIDKNIAGANVKFSAGISINPPNSEKFEMNINGKSAGGIWALGIWTSELIGVRNGDSIIVTIRDK